MSWLEYVVVWRRKTCRERGFSSLPRVMFKAATGQLPNAVLVAAVGAILVPVASLLDSAGTVPVHDAGLVAVVVPAHRPCRAGALSLAIVAASVFVRSHRGLGRDCDRGSGNTAGKHVAHSGHGGGGRDRNTAGKASAEFAVTPLALARLSKNLRGRAGSCAKLRVTRKAARRRKRILKKR